ncbi:beta-phosphoglucomutase [Nonlabens sp. MIC269]|uniref:beta-phosphoglucomutase n=1 Tax=Nonlabens TaxID=363408 RepID=UPI000721A266|nr:MULTISPECIES: beta-phosphoglucomutase [Nonlabens]ALM21416.1 beta-phosphoglucomutase [Nonlabens sp. MIC269]ARN71867.1 beta-phosphoglucomutase [Nonlabens tegetincola]
MNKKAFIFDLDGVVVDTAKFHFVAWQRLAADIGINFTEKENEQLKGVSRVDSLKKILEWGNKTLPQEEFDEKLIEKNNQYLSLIEGLSVNDILPGVHSFLLDLKAKSQPIALGSASKNARPILKKLGIIDLFDVIVDGTNVTKAKPNPEVFLSACSQLGYKAADSIVFEDSQAGVQAANTAGMISIGLGDQTNLNEADAVFQSFEEMPSDYIKTLLNTQK